MVKGKTSCTGVTNQYFELLDEAFLIFACQARRLHLTLLSMLSRTHVGSDRDIQLLEEPPCLPDRKDHADECGAEYPDERNNDLEAVSKFESTDERHGR